METQLWTYLVAITLLTLTPGVDTLLVIRNSSRGGWRDGAVSSFGICAGLLVHAVVSAVGISVILLQSALAFGLLKFAGAAYLVWLGALSLQRARRRGDARLAFATPCDRQFRARRSLLEGFLSNLLNPKTVVFYMAFLPQFIDPSRSALPQALLLAGLHFLVAMVYQCLLAALVDRAKGWLGRSLVRRGLDGLAGSLMLLFGLKLALDR